MTWTAPHESNAVMFNVAANASNDDASALGDFIYLAQATAEAPFAPGHAVPRPDDTLRRVPAK
jgi:hypothetical protein